MTREYFSTASEGGNLKKNGLELDAKRNVKKESWYGGVEREQIVGLNTYVSGYKR